MTPQTKLALRRWILRQLRYVIDLADDRLHSAEVNLRQELAAGKSLPPRPDPPAVGACCARRPVETFAQWEARRSGVAVISKKEARRRRGVTAAAFDRSFANGR